MKVDTVSQRDYKELIELWEASVRATHDFINAEYIAFLRPLILDKYFEHVDLHCVKDHCHKILGFIGVADKNIEMLFVSPDCIGQGIGTLLTKYAIEHMDAIKVDVNEQNLPAIGFYKHIGFTVVGKSSTDSQGKPYPLLHMKLNEE